MPWKEPGEKPREPNEPWGTGQRPGNRPNRPGGGFDLEAQLKRLRRNFGPFGGGPAGLLALIVLAVLVWVAVGSWTLIDARETGILLRFGQYQRTLAPGLHVHLPRPFAQVVKVDTGRVRTVSDQIRMLTRDGQIALVDFFVQYKVADARKFLFAVRDPEDAMRQVTLATVRAQVGMQELSQLMRSDNGAVMDRIRVRLQRTLDDNASGIVVNDVGIQNVLAPQEARAAYEDVGNARQDAQRAESEARAVAAKSQADARAKAAQLRADADAYKTRTIATAQAEAARFNLVLGAYQAAPDVTRRQLWSQAMRDVLSVSRVVIDTTGRAVVQLPPQSGTSESKPAPAASSPAPEKPPRIRLHPEAPGRCAVKMFGMAIVLLLVLAAANSVFVVREGHAALLLQFGNIESAALAPGLHFKLPFVQRADVYDTRAIVTESEPDDFQTGDGNAVQVGFYVRWRIVDPQAYYRATSGEELQATQQMTPLIHDALRSQVQAHTLADLIGSDNGAIGTRLRTLVDPETRQRLGVQILGVGIERVDFPDPAAGAVYKRMQANAKAEAATLRGQGEDKAAAIRADAENQAQALLAQAQKDAATSRGEGDAQAAKIYADAAARDPAFFRFWSGLQAYRDTFGDGHAVIVLDQSSPLLKAIGDGTSNTAPAKEH